MKLEINNKRKTENFTIMWKLNTKQPMDQKNQKGN